MISCRPKLHRCRSSCSVPNIFAGLTSQPFPTSGPLAANMDHCLSRLRNTIPASQMDDPVYVYILTTVKVQSRGFVQQGTAPNFQGGCMTLCTCKHKDRASPPPSGCRGPNLSDPWRGVWVAGLCSPSQLRPRGLFYLMRVERTFASHARCWNGLGSPLVKSAHRHPFGDIYEPLPAAGHAPWSASSYKAHLRGHCHSPKERENDIEARYYAAMRHPSLLVGDPCRSYLWSAPLITLFPVADAGWGTAHHRFFAHLRDFFSLLR